MSALLRTTREYDPPLTVDEFERLPEGEGKQELHDGRAVQMAPVGDLHGQTVIELGARLRDYVRGRGGRRFGRLVTETGFVLWPERPRESRAPDLAFIPAAAPATRYLVRGRPALAVEVLSPNDQPAEVLVKVREYLGAGVPLVWVLEPLVGGTVYRPDTAPRRLGADGVLDGEDLLPGFRLPLTEVWTELAAPEDDVSPGTEA